MKVARALAAPLGLAAAAGLAGCFTARHTGPPPTHPTPVSTAPPVGPVPLVPQDVPDAVPRVEPLSHYGNPPYYEVFGKRYYVLSSSVAYVERGVASWYGPGFHQVLTSTREPYDMYAMTAAHKTLPLPAYVRVTNLQNGRSIVVRVNDRGPFVGNRIIDLSYTAAAKLDMLRNGTAMVEVRAIDPRAQAQGTLAPILTANAAAGAAGQGGAAMAAGAVSPTSSVPSPAPAGGATTVAGSAPSTAPAAAAPAVPSPTQAPPSAAASAPSPTSPTTVSVPVASAPSPTSPTTASVPAASAPLSTTPPTASISAALAAPSTPPPTAAAPSAIPPALFIQAGAFADPANAERLAARLRGGGYGKIFVRDDVIAGRRMYRVRIGPVPNVPEFDRIVAALEREGVHDAHLALN